MLIVEYEDGFISGSTLSLPKPV